MQGRAPRTLTRYRYVVRQFRVHAQIEDIGDVGPNNVKALFYWGRTERGWSVNTFLNVHKTLKVFFRWCIREGYMDGNYVDDIEVPRLEKRLVTKLTAEQALRILEVVYNFPGQGEFERARNHAMMAVYLFAGLRRQELLKLTVTDVDLNDMSIFVRQAKGAKDRIVPISTRLGETLRRYQALRTRAGRTCPEFFTSCWRNIPVSDTVLKRLVERTRKAIGMKFTVHQLRHTFATLMLEGGCDIYALSKMLGHSDIKTTTIYLAASSQHLRAQIRKHPLN